MEIGISLHGMGVSFQDNLVWEAEVKERGVFQIVPAEPQ